MPPSCSLRQSPETLAAFALAAAFAEQCLSEGRLLNSHEAMALAGGEARGKETLYSIARAFAQSEDVDLADLLCDLERKFPEQI